MTLHTHLFSGGEIATSGLKIEIERFDLSDKVLLSQKSIWDPSQVDLSQLPTPSHRLAHHPDRCHFYQVLVLSYS